MSNWSTKVNVLQATGANPIIKIWNLITSISNAVSGSKKSGELIDDGDYLVLHTKRKTLFFFTAAQSSLKIAKSRISGIRVSNEKRYLIFRSTVCEIFAAGVTESTVYEVKCSYKVIQEKADSWLS